MKKLLRSFGGVKVYEDKKMQKLILYFSNPRIVTTISNDPKSRRYHPALYKKLAGHI